VERRGEIGAPPVLILLCGIGSGVGITIVA
jgi:hypothetical protein